VGISIFRVCLDSMDLILSFMVAMGNKQRGIRLENWKSETYKRWGRRLSVGFNVLCDPDKKKKKTKYIP
jgi:hypothetical protein